MPPAMRQVRPSSGHGDGRRVERRPGLDGMRAIAVAAVVAFHLDRLPGGNLGVDAFLVISGWVITSALLASVDPTARRLDLTSFWSARVRRLLPASAVTLIVVSVVWTASGDPGDIVAPRRAVRAGLGGQLGHHHERRRLLGPLRRGVARRPLLVACRRGAVLPGVAGRPLDRGPRRRPRPYRGLGRPRAGRRIGDHDGRAVRPVEPHRHLPPHRRPCPRSPARRCRGGRLARSGPPPLDQPDRAGRGAPSCRGGRGDPRLWRRRLDLALPMGLPHLRRGHGGGRDERGRAPPGRTPRPPRAAVGRRPQLRDLPLALACDPPARAPARRPGARARPRPASRSRWPLRGPRTAGSSNRSADPPT